MRRDLENALVRLNAVLDVVDRYKVVWQSSTPFSECVAELLHLKTSIDAERLLIENSTEGVTKTKRNAEKVLVQTGYLVSAGLAAFATRTKDEILLARVNVPKGVLGEMRDNDLIATCRLFVAEAKLRNDVLEDYQVTLDDVTQLEAAITRFEALVPSPQRTINDNKTKREDLGDLFKQANTLMRNDLDRMVAPYEVKANEFYKAYKNARKAVKLGVRHNNTDTNSKDSEEDSNS